MKRLQALHANAFAFAANFRPLKVGIFAGPVDRIVVAAKQAALADHL